MKYEKPNLELIVLDSEDVIRTSQITNGGKGDNNDGTWGTNP